MKQFVRYVINSIRYRRFCFLYLDILPGRGGGPMPHILCPYRTGGPCGGARFLEILFLIFEFDQVQDYDYHHSSSLNSENFEIRHAIWK